MRAWALYLILSAAAAYVVVPMAVVMAASLNRAGLPGFLPQTWTMANYSRVLSDPKFLRAAANSFVVAGGSMAVSVLVSGTAGYAFSRYEFPGKRVLMGVILGIFMIPVAVNVIPLYVMLQRLGWLDTYHGLIVSYQALILPLNVWLLKNFLDTIPRELEEAALVDGATLTGAFWRVTLPLIWPGVAVASMFAFRFSWNDFVFASTFTATPSMQTWQAVMYSFLGVEGTDWGTLTAGVTIGMVPMIVLLLLFQRQFIEGLTMGGVK